MTDPDAANSAPPPQPPRPNPQAQQSQLEADERFARQLAEHYENVGAHEARATQRSQLSPQQQRPQHTQQQMPRQQNQGQWQPQNQGQWQPQNQGQWQPQNQGPRVTYPARGSSRAHTSPTDENGIEREYSFIDDDLPALRDGLRKGFVETQTKVNSWVKDFMKKIDDTFDDGHNQPAQDRTPTPYTRSTSGQRSSDYHRYDADPEVLSDDFAGIKLAPDGSKFQAVASPLDNSLGNHHTNCA